ncbi:hypothetical protein R1sor_001968 [Riccia sorocarpa]|uniref:Uncharacterized protein n=1 Tax=Riccia sorocarpa TaxID=122646 RepID=A0ABD3GZ35_9MARC
MAIQTTMAAITSKPVHALIQQLDCAAVESNKEAASKHADSDNQAALLLECLGIHHWIGIQHTFSTKGEDATLAVIRQLHDELPSILEIDNVEDGRAAKLSNMIGRMLSWINLKKETQNDNGEPKVDGSYADISSQVRANPIINFAIFSKEERDSYAESLDNINANAAGEKALMSEDGDPFIPTDTPRTVEYRVSEKNGMMWKIPNMNNLAPITIDMWTKLVNLSEGELDTCRNNAINDTIPAKLLNLKDTVKMAFFRDKYKCSEPVSVRIKAMITTDSNRVAKHKALLWNWMRPYLRCNCKFDANRKTCKGEIIWLDHAIWYIFNHLSDFFHQPSIQAKYMAFLIFLGSELRSAIMAQCAFMFARQMMITTALEVFSDPTVPTLPEHGEAAGVRMIERLMKPACFSDNLISRQIQSNNKKRPRQANPINLNSAPTRMIPMGRGQRMRGGRQFNSHMPFHNSPGSGSSSSRSWSSAMRITNLWTDILYFSHMEDLGFRELTTKEAPPLSTLYTVTAHSNGFIYVIFLRLDLLTVIWWTLLTH